MGYPLAPTAVRAQPVLAVVPWAGSGAGMVGADEVRARLAGTSGWGDEHGSGSDDDEGATDAQASHAGAYTRWGLNELLATSEGRGRDHISPEMRGRMASIREARKAAERERGQEREDDGGDGVPKAMSQDHYAALGLGAAGLGASADELKAAYRAMVLVTHPDKNEDMADGKAFDAVQVAFDLLSDPAERVKYDSLYRTCDAVPSEDDMIRAATAGGNAYYELLRPVFARNLRWSLHEPTVADFGDAESPYADVEAFYDFWLAFESWRDLSMLCEYDLSKAGDRYERRWMLKHNERENKARRKAEVARLDKLVRTAQKYDPRIKAAKAAARKAKADAKAAKKAEAKARREAQAQARKAKAEAKAAAEEAAAAEAAAKRQQRQRLRKTARKTIRQHAKTAELEFTLCEQFVIDAHEDELIAVYEELVSEEQAVVIRKIISAAAAGVKARIEESRQILARENEARKARQAASAKVSSKPWTADELSLFAKAVAKFPGGTANRWQEIAGFVGRSVKECQVKMRDYKSMPPPSATTTASSPTPSAPSPAPAAGAPAGPPMGDWTPTQQKQLEDAMVKYTKDMGKERWKAIAAAVDGKNKKECKARFKELVLFYSQQGK
ncbi:uncharacterized protein AMSG_04450 [Thecamonas trahens ATCC 50062]|uniref:DnaJ subfamily C member 2 n=1 Tax=Thecamonas trahens ATCC 50062 TaxID=461836 RepID=A0A0L0D7N8_THETB|nr:hypothetical protein AMSG_04450 [Thecamonas trahens ATCC 50062]KNC48220.1 hypothetical protein AMSG_04450 [Thecamonas trahens ATCC 50062]|eukprot:XP_013758789.1 hypothetical protein AMSG_04450 [Thecamonas trahens ATCC 50062]